MVTITTGRPPKHALRKLAGKVKTPASVVAAYKEYVEAYNAIYGVKPTGYRYDAPTKFIYVGNSGGVSLARLKDMTRQLRYRKG